MLTGLVWKNYSLFDHFTVYCFSEYLCKNNHCFEAMFWVGLISFPRCLYALSEYVN